MHKSGTSIVENVEVEETHQSVVAPEAGFSALRGRAAELARALTWLPRERVSRPFQDRCQSLSRVLSPLIAKLESSSPKLISDDFRWLRDNLRLLETELEEARESFRRSTKLPQVRLQAAGVGPRIAELASDFLQASEYEFHDAAFSAYIQSFQQTTVLKLVELWLLPSVLKLVLLERIAARASDVIADPSRTLGIEILIRSLREVGQADWKGVVEPLILFDRILREDPAGAYSQMDFESRELYRKKLVNLADHSDCTEMEVAREAVALARRAAERPTENPRLTRRQSHVGFYLLAEGTPLLEQKIGFHHPLAQRCHAFLRAHPDEIYLTGIVALTFAIMAGDVILLTNPGASLWLILVATLALLLPSSQSAVQIMNYLATAVLPADILPKLDFADGLPSGCATLVCIPTILFSEKQVQKLAEDLEVRFLGNQDPNLHFVLLTDLPDSPEEPREHSSLVDLCAHLMVRLNRKYAESGMGSFLLLHRRRIYNPREQLWMGWERKRGKLMDLNNLICGENDAFPIKAGNVDVLPAIRYVITLDSDTELPRGAARRMVGALAHPLNEAILDPETSSVVAGYGILQPRVGVSVQSTARSRLASIYSGETGFDIYTRAVSDVYQDLYGEGTFVGKGIYEVETLQRALDRRFPRNALLSHDLIEGAYARAGLVSDIEVIEDYPSHYSAYNRRKHRWLRGDWQIAGWLRPEVPDESGRRVPNTLSVISQWKILDNLRRSLVEPATFILLLLGWLLPLRHPALWTLATVAIVFFPAWFQLPVDLSRAAFRRLPSMAGDAWKAFVDANLTSLLTLTFLAYQALLSADAVVRTLVRRFITRQRLLQWETAAQAELAGHKRTMLDVYLDCTPLLSLAVFGLIWLVHRRAIFAAAPILLLWLVSKPVSLWLNRPPRAPRKRLSSKHRRFLRLSALRVWRYFAEFSTAEHHWLVPDNVQQEPPNVAARVSPTNLGFLLNARQVACKMGYLTLPEFAEQTLRTLATVSQLEKYRGHLFNWYDTRSLGPLPPVTVSAVDSGNLVASLWTLRRGAIELLEQPLLQPGLAEGFRDHLALLADLKLAPRWRRREGQQDWIATMINVPEEPLQRSCQKAAKPKRAAASWFAAQAQERILQFRRTVTLYLPWLSPDYATLLDHTALGLSSRGDGVSLEKIPDFIDALELGLRSVVKQGSAETQSRLAQQLLSSLAEARPRVQRLIEDLKSIAASAAQIADEMDFSFLLDRKRRLLSVGFDVKAGQLNSACYDLLATEARIATFVAIAKDDIPQESWFLLGRPHALNHGRPVLLSWTGTMFEYLMPSLWMRVYPNTLLERAEASAVKSQRDYVAERRIPWGISESAYFRTDEAGNYQYHAFGVPQLAVHKIEPEAPVISPYSSFLALHVDPAAALRNLRRMVERKWVGTYGFFEAVDFNPKRISSWWRRHRVVPCWMAHHQGMSMLAIANFLDDDVIQRWFHGHPRVQATELLLQEKPSAHGRPLRRTNRRAA